MSSIKNVTYLRIWQTLGLLILAGLTAHPIATERYDLLALLVVVSVGIFVVQTRMIFLVILIFTAFFVNSFTQLGLIPGQANWLTELLIMGLFVRMLTERIATGRQIRLFGGPIVTIFVVIIISSILLNQVQPVGIILFMRLILRFYLLMVVLVNLDYDESFMLRINKLIAWLFIIQIPTGVVKMFINGGIQEINIGTYAMWSGGPTTIIPLIAIGFLVSHYFLYKKSLNNLWLALGFIAFSIIGNKRGFMFYLPVVFIFISWNFRNQIRKYYQFMFLSVLIILLTLYFASRFIPTLNPERKVWGTFSIEYIKNYALDYTTKEVDGKAIGRTSATIAIYNYLAKQGMYTAMFGTGPGKIMKSTFKSHDTSFTKQEDEIGVGYGMTGLNWLAIQVGYIGAAVWFSFYVYALWTLFGYYKRETNAYWCAFNMGMLNFCFVAIIMNITYNHVLISDDTFTMVFFILLAFAIRRNEILVRNRNLSNLYQQTC